MTTVINSPKQLFGVCSIQSGLREVGLYTGNIDGLFGESSYKGLSVLLGCEVERVVGWDAKTLFFNIQRVLLKLGFDIGKPDGIWGNKSQSVLNGLLDLYRRSHSLNQFGHAWSNHKNVTEEGVDKITGWMKRMSKPESHVSYLLSCICFETAGTFSPDVENKASHAIGLIQFMPKKLKEWNITKNYISSLSFYSQLDYVFKFFEEYGYIKKCARLEDYYLSIFYPAAVGKDPDTIIAKKGSIVYTQNFKAFDKANKGFYTIGDICKPVVERYWLGMSPVNRVKVF